MMNKKHCMNWKNIGWSAAWLLLAACTHELDSFGEGGGQSGSDHGNGQCYVVDYAEVGEEGAGTRALLSDGELPPNKRISSLTYLLYEGDDLVKCRKISDIGTSTTWPLTRSTMTWAQRQELKDTLELDRQYTAVFIANSWRDEVTDDEGLLDETNQLLKNRQTLSQAYLVMPAEGFTDATLYYIDKKEISFATGNADGIDRDHPYNCPVALSRIVARTDIERTDTGLNGGTDEEEAFKAYLAGALEEMETDLLADAGTVYTSLRTYLGTLANLYDAETGTYAASYDKLAEAIRNSVPTIWDKQKDAITQAVHTELLTDCAANTAIRAQCAPWQDYQTATVTYDTPANAFGLDKLEAVNRAGLANDASSLTYGICPSDDDTPGKVVMAGLGAAGCNTIQTLTLANEDNTQIVFTGLEFATGHGKNELLRLVCNPLGKLDYAEGAATKNVTVTLDWDEYITIEVFNDCFVSVEGGTQDGFVQEAQAKLAGYDTHQYGSWDSFNLQLTLPDMSQDGSAVCTPTLSRDTE